jgi:hypothetical protein
MALGVSTSADILATLKVWYADQKVENLLFRNDPVLKAIKKVRIGGKQYPLPMLYSRGGATTSNYNLVSTLATQSYGAREMEIEPGQLFSSFVLSPKEYLASNSDKGAYISILGLKAFSALEGWRKVMAKALYGEGFLEQGRILAIDIARTTITVSSATAAGLDIGSEIIFALNPEAANRAGGAVGVLAFSDRSDGDVDILVDAALNVAVQVGDSVLIEGGKDSNNDPNAPVGLAGWLPSKFNRTGANWASYIGTDFFGVDRSVYVNRLAGNFVLRDSVGNESYVNAIVRLIKNIRRQGGVPNAIVLNDNDYEKILQEVQAQTTYFQQMNMGGGLTSNEFTNGLSAMSFQFSTSWLKMVYDTPYCEEGVGYVLDLETVMMLCLSNGAGMDEKAGPSKNNPGSPEAGSEPEPTTNFQFLVDDYYTTRDVTTADGAGIQVDYNFYGQFAITAPGHNGVVRFEPDSAT